MRTPLSDVNIIAGLLLLTIACPSAQAETIRYSYDIMGQLTKAEYDSGTIITYTYDKMGNRQNRVTTFIATAAPGITTGSASQITGSGATLNGSVMANNLDTTVTFEYGLNTSYGSSVPASQNPVTGNTTTSVSGAITGLTPFGTVYHYRAVATNSKGTTYGSDKTLTTSNYLMVVAGITGSGTGTLSKSPATMYFPCSGVPTCAGMMTATDGNAVITCNPAADSYLSNWSGCDSVSGSSCTIYPTSDKNVNATVNLYPVAKFSNATTYSLKIKDAFDAAKAGDVIKILDQGLTENLTYTTSAAVSLKGGFAPGFANNTGYSTITGTLKITAGKLAVERILLKN